jgi:hypothetical protein
VKLIQQTVYLFIDEVREGTTVDLLLTLRINQFGSLRTTINMCDRLSFLSCKALGKFVNINKKYGILTVLLLYYHLLRLLLVIGTLIFTLNVSFLSHLECNFNILPLLVA